MSVGVDRSMTSRHLDHPMTTCATDVNGYEEALAKQLAALLVAELRRRDRLPDARWDATRNDQGAEPQGRPRDPSCVE